MIVDPLSTASRVLDFLRDAGDMEYHGEKVSQLEHALQAAHQATLDGGSEEEIIAALLHDIGHIWPAEGREVTSVGVIRHDAIGAQVLRDLGFSDAVAAIVGGHVEAKRYLVATDREYAEQLSEVSVESLRRQGGPMSEREIEAFSKARHFRETVRVRLWDDRAKTPGAPVPNLENYRQLLTDHLAGSPREDA